MKNLLGLSVFACALISGHAMAATPEATGDFNGDGVTDRARLEGRTLDAVLVLELGGGKVNRKSLPGLNVANASLTMVGRGSEFSAACLRGVGKDCKESAETRIVLENDGVVVHVSEASATLYYLKAGSLKSLTLSD